jgi:hypothetical protein
MSDIMLRVIMLSVIMLSVIMLSVIMLIVIILSTFLLNDIMLRVIMLNVIMLSAIAPVLDNEKHSSLFNKATTVKCFILEAPSEDVFELSHLYQHRSCFYSLKMR